MSRLVLIAFLAIANVGQARAQDLERLVEEDVFLFTARAFGDDFFEGIRFQDDARNEVEMDFDPYSRTRIYSIRSDQTELSFFRWILGPDGEAVQETVAVADLEDVESRALLAFLSIRDAERNLPYTVLVADESPGAFEAGSLRFLNLSGSSLLARVGDDTLPLGFGFGGDIRFEDIPSLKMPFEFAVRVSGAWKRIYSTNISLHPELGTLAILRPPRELDSTRIQVELKQSRVFPEIPEGAGSEN